MNVTIFTKTRALKDLAETVTDKDVCYFLSDDYLSYIRLRNNLKGKCPIHLLGSAFHEAIRQIEAEFLSFCHRIAERNQPESYWGTNLASRNSANIPLLKYMAFFHCASALIKQNRQTFSLVFVCDSRALASVLCEEAKSRGCCARIHSSVTDALEKARLYSRLFLRSAYFLTVGVFKWFLARSLKNRRINKDNGRKKYALRSWITAGCINGNGIYKDRNFGSLPKYLEEQGGEVWTIPMYFNLDRSIFAQMKLMADSPHPFLLPEQYLSLLDILKTFIDGLKGTLLNLAHAEFEGQDFSKVVREVHLWSSLSTELLACNSVKYLLKRLQERGVRFDSFIYPIENNAPEKMFIQSVRKYFQNARLVGFQHTVWFKEQLGVYLHPEEIQYHPLPDKVICSGNRYPDILRQTGFPSVILESGPNLRYTAVNQAVQTTHRDLGGTGTRHVLIILNFDQNQMVEFLDKTGEALRGFNDVKIKIKSHPLYPIGQLKQFLADIRFPAFEWAEGSVLDEVLRSDVVLMTGGSVSNLETIVTGVPLLRVSLGSNFDFDCLWEEYPFAPFVNSPEEIRRYLSKAFALTEEEKGELLAFGKDVVKNYFEPITRDHMKRFL